MFKGDCEKSYFQCSSTVRAIASGDFELKDLSAATLAGWDIDLFGVTAAPHLGTLAKTISELSVQHPHRLPNFA